MLLSLFRISELYDIVKWIAVHFVNFAVKCISVESVGKYFHSYAQRKNAKP
jgi:hypothetical protein